MPGEYPQVHRYIKGIIGLPNNLFQQAQAFRPASLLLDDERAQTRIDAFMIDAFKGFIKDGDKNRARARHPQNC